MRRTASLPVYQLPEARADLACRSYDLLMRCWRRENYDAKTGEPGR